MTNDDLNWFHSGNHCRLFKKLGAHLAEDNSTPGAQFSVWAPHAQRVSVIGEFNHWSKSQHPLEALGASGIWSGFIPGIAKGTLYKYHIISRDGQSAVDKADPFAVCHETPPRTASIIWDLEYSWGDAAWMASRNQCQTLTSPISIYEVHLSSWRRVPEEGNRWLTYRELAPTLARYAKQHGFTHVEFLAFTQHPFYQPRRYHSCDCFAPASHLGTPQDLMYLIDILHQHGLGVILDWAPAFISADAHGLASFDGTCLFENPNLPRGADPDWNLRAFNYHSPEARSFLLSSAVFWLDCYHIDGLRIDSMVPMLYPDWISEPGASTPSDLGARENIEAVNFLRQFNQTINHEHPGTQTWAGESGSCSHVSRPVNLGGLGFGFKWDRRWTHDILHYLGQDPQHRQNHHRHFSARTLHAFSENYVLPLSHEEAARGQGSLLGRMPGDEWQKFANLRLLLAYQWALPGKKLLFMGNEFGQWNEWNHETSLDWHLAQDGNFHNDLQKLVGFLNWLYRTEPALHEKDASPDGFEWIDADDAAHCILSFMRASSDAAGLILAAFNFTPSPLHNVRVGVIRGGFWREILNTDARDYGGSGQGNQGGVEAAPFGWHSKSHSLHLTLPPLGAVLLKSPPLSSRQPSAE